MNGEDRNSARATGPLYSAEDARGGEIILRSRRRRVIFIAGLIAWVVVMLFVPNLF